MIERTLADWRALPWLRIKEAAAIAGISARAMESYVGLMEVRRVGHTRFIVTESFRRWLGEKVEEPAKAEVVDLKMRRKVAKALKEMA